MLISSSKIKTQQSLSEAEGGVKCMAESRGGQSLFIQAKEKMKWQLHPQFVICMLHSDVSRNTLLLSCTSGAWLMVPWIRVHLIARRRKWPHYLLWGINDILTSFNNYQTLQVCSRQVLIYLEQVKIWSALPQSWHLPVLWHSSPWLCGPQGNTDHAHYRKSCDVYKVVPSSSSECQLLCCAKNCDPYNQHIYHECKAKHMLGREAPAALHRGKLGKANPRPGSGILLDWSYLHGTSCCGALNTFSPMRAPLPGRRKKIFVQGEMGSLWQDKELNHPPSVKPWTAFPLAMGPFFHGHLVHLSGSFKRTTHTKWKHSRETQRLGKSMY